MSHHLSEVCCPLCGERDPRTRYSFEACEIVRCQACGLMWLYPPLSEEQLHETYDESYYANLDFLKGENASIYGYVDYLSERINKQYDYKQIVIRVHDLLRLGSGGRQQPLWLDFGCGLGFLMDVAFDYGFKVSGIEFNPAAVRFIRSKYNFRIEQGLLANIPLEEKYSVISMFDVIEHLIDPAADLKRLRQMVADDGYLLIQTMDSDSFSSRLFGKRLEDFRRIREHLYFFSRPTITRLLADCGWEVTEIQSIGHTFQISFLLDRLALLFPLAPVLTRVIRFLIYPKYLLEANIYINPRTKMLVYARPK